jgi:hypothetical protein
MHFAGRRLILDRGFDRAMEVVLDAFLREGFSITPVRAGGLRCGGNVKPPRRYALFDAALSELLVNSTAAILPPPLFRCRVSVFELSGSGTLVTVESPFAHYPALARLVPGIPERIQYVMRALQATRIPTAA